AEDGIRDFHVTGVQTCALPIYSRSSDSNNDVMGCSGSRLEEWKLDQTMFAIAAFAGFLIGTIITLIVQRSRQAADTRSRCARRKIGRASCRERVEMSEVG